jgi:hypothetical protein
MRDMKVYKWKVYEITGGMRNFIRRFQSHTDADAYAVRRGTVGRKFVVEFDETV